MFKIFSLDSSDYFIVLLAIALAFIKTRYSETWQT